MRTRTRRTFSPALDSLPYRIVPSAYPPTSTIVTQPSTTTTTTGIDPNDPMAAPTVGSPTTTAPGSPTASDPMASPTIS